MGDRGKTTYSFALTTNPSQEKRNAPRNAPMKIQMIMYPLKYIASNMMKYATANWNRCKVARTNCSTSVGRIINWSPSNGVALLLVVAVAAAAAVVAVALFSSCCGDGCCWSLSLPVPFPFGSFLGVCNREADAEECSEDRY